jgi:hypothetical protein
VTGESLFQQIEVARHTMNTGQCIFGCAARDLPPVCRAPSRELKDVVAPLLVYLSRLLIGALLKHDSESPKAHYTKSPNTA